MKNSKSISTLLVLATLWSATSVAQVDKSNPNLSLLELSTRPKPAPNFVEFKALSENIVHLRKLIELQKTPGFNAEPRDFKEYLRSKELMRDGGVSTGGGDEYVIDFIQTAQLEVYPWAKKNQDIINAEKLLTAIQPEKIQSADRLFETCQFKIIQDDHGHKTYQGVPSNPQDPPRQACYNQNLDVIFLSRELYPLNVKNTPSKMSLVAHELLRRLRLEGNEYLITGQWNFSIRLEENEISDIALASMIKGKGIVDVLYQDAIQACKTHTNILVSEPTLQRLDQINLQFQIASGLMNERVYKEQFNTCALKSIRSYSLLLGLGHGTMEVNFLSKNFTAAPACLFLHFFKEAKLYSDEISKSLDTHQKGEDSPELCPSESYKLIRQKLNNSVD